MKDHDFGWPVGMTDWTWNRDCDWSCNFCLVRHRPSRIENGEFISEQFFWDGKSFSLDELIRYRKLTAFQ